MRSATVYGLGALFALTMACSSDDAKSDPAPTPSNDAAADATQETSTPPDTSLPKCPDEIDLETVSLPCDCYGHEANATTIVDPKCLTQVVCCPSIANLRCEDHEYCDDAGNCWDSATNPNLDASGDAAPACKNEVDLSTQTLPCDCYGTIVTDPKVDMPNCTLTVVCCPAIQGLKCE